MTPGAETLTERDPRITMSGFMSADHTRLLRPLTAYTKGGVQMSLGVGTLVRRPFRAAGATHFLASQDGVQWLPCHTTDEVETEAA
jgi:hypothetical protein